jgi:RNA polymerase sigma-70 factor (ECF subfamily)
MKTLHIAQIRNFSDEDVMELFQGGYDEAFTEIVERYRDKIHNFIFRYTRNHLDCEDIVQETFFRVYRCRHSYERIARFSTWLYTIANNLVRSHYKKNSRLKTTSIFETDSNDQEYEIDIVDTEQTPDADVNISIMMEYVQKALSHIPVDFKEVIVMRDIQNLTYEEIMEITGLPMGTVKSRINRGRVRLQVLINSYTREETFQYV